MPAVQTYFPASAAITDSMCRDPSTNVILESVLALMGMASLVQEYELGWLARQGKVTALPAAVLVSTGTTIRLGGDEKPDN